MKPETKMKEQFKDRLLIWTEATLGTKFDNLNQFQRSRQMIMFFVQEVLGKLDPGIVPDDEGELESSIIDGSGDGGADLLYRTDDGQVLIIQAKYRGKDATESPESVGRVCDILERLYLAMEGKQESLHKDLLELASQINWEEDIFNVYFITSAKTGDAVKDRVKQGLVHIPDLPDLKDRSFLHYLDQSLLNQALRDAISSADFSERPIIIPMIPDSDDKPWCHFEGDDREIYVGEVNGAVLAQLLQTHKSSLFTMNIRDYVGDTKTNKQIIDTALKDPLNFEYFNNGVTAVAGKISPDSKAGTLTCERMSIINGAQTVKSLLVAVNRPGEKHHKPVSSVRVLLRLMSFEYPAEVPFVAEVTKYNNTQNAVKIADFRSNDEVQKDMARRFDSVNLLGRKYEYKNKRSRKDRNTIAITLEELTKALYAFQFGPDDMWGGTSKLFDVSSTGLYTKIFESPDSPLTESDFSLKAGTFLACDKVKNFWETHRKTHRSKQLTMHPALERKGLVYYAVGELERQTYAKQSWSLDQDLSKLAKPNTWLATENTPPQMALLKAFEIASRVLIQQYDAKKRNDLSFKHRNWFRNPETLRAINEGLELALEFGLPPRLWP
ncbi:AIPR family protein [Tunturiibacter gelidiferens]|uniref:AIPR family protein n=1 Tax=Tunturiibacter gelidiferens TaxID=3069689 RepID=UPI003D9BC79D